MNEEETSHFMHMYEAIHKLRKHQIRDFEPFSPPLKCMDKMYKALRFRRNVKSVRCL